MTTTADNTTADSLQPLPPQALPGLIGASLATPVECLRSLVDEVRSHGLPAPLLDAMDEAVGQAHRISVQSQQLARLAAGGLRLAKEPVPLHAALLDLLAQHQGEFKRQSITLRQHLRPVDAKVDPGLLLSLLEALVDWAARPSCTLLVRLDMKHWPEVGLLTLHANWAPQAGDPGGPADPDNLAWQLAACAAAQLGLALSRSLGEDHVQATLVFPDTVRQASGGITAMQGDRTTGPDVSLIEAEAKQLVGLNVLLVSEDARVQRDVAAVCKELGMKLQSTGHPRLAHELSEQSQPELILLDEILRDEQFEHYLKRLERERPHFRAMEITDRDTGFEISAWDGMGRTRIGRDTVRDQLKTVLAIEFGR